jgi:hypothetical protein
MRENIGLIEAERIERVRPAAAGAMPPSPSGTFFKNALL